ncbi:hypothetical protein [Paludibacterium paludis]|uniref:hypothetical protein n=1 Tax=Paludibacterium paludis TaxID=1225769 RepID=UPI001679F96B|nr:hypothetical protein [Paludibacterium paludis]
MASIVASLQDSALGGKVKTARGGSERLSGHTTGAMPSGGIARRSGMHRLWRAGTVPLPMRDRPRAA